MMDPGLAPLQSISLPGRFYKRGKFFQFYKKRIVFIDRHLPHNINLKIHMDVVVITGSPGIQLRQVKDLFYPGEIIIDASNSIAKTEGWIKEARNLGLKISVISKIGARIIDF